MEEQAENFSLWMDMEGPQFATPTTLLCTCAGFSYTDGNIPRCHQLIFHLSLLHT